MALSKTSRTTSSISSQSPRQPANAQSTLLGKSRLAPAAHLTRFGNASRVSGALGYTYRRRRSGPNWGLIVSLVLVAGAAAYFVPQYLNPQAGPPPPPLGSDAAPASAAAPSPVATSATVRLPEADQQLAGGKWRAAADIYADVARAAPNQAAAHAGWARALIYGNKPAEAIELLVLSVLASR